MPQRIGKIIAQREIDCRDSGLPVEENSGQRHADDQERKKRKQHVGRHGESVDVDLRLHPIAEGQGQRAEDSAARLGRSCIPPDYD